MRVLAWLFVLVSTAFAGQRIEATVRLIGYSSDLIAVGNDLASKSDFPGTPQDLVGWSMFWPDNGEWMEITQYDSGEFGSSSWIYYHLSPDYVTSNDAHWGDTFPLVLCEDPDDCSDSSFVTPPPDAAGRWEAMVRLVGYSDNMIALGNDLASKSGFTGAPADLVGLYMYWAANDEWMRINQYGSGEFGSSSWIYVYLSPDYVTSDDNHWGDTFPLILCENPDVCTQTAEPTTSEPTTAEPTTAEPTTSEPTTSDPTTSEPTTAEPTTADPTTAEPTTAEPTTAEPTTSEPTTAEPTTAEPTTSEPTTAEPTERPTRRQRTTRPTRRQTTARPQRTTRQTTTTTTLNPTGAPTTTTTMPYGYLADNEEVQFAYTNGDQRFQYVFADGAAQLYSFNVAEATAITVRSHITGLSGSPYTVTVGPTDAAYPSTDIFNVETLLQAIGDNIEGRGWGGIFYKHSDGTEGSDDWSYWTKVHTIQVTVPSGVAANQPFENPLRPANDLAGVSAVSDSAMSISLSSPMMMGIMAVLVAVLALNLVFMCYLNCCKGKGSHSYKQVDANDSEFESEANALNVASA